MKCQQSLSYESYLRHTQLPHLFCPHYKKLTDTTESNSDTNTDADTDSTFNLTDSAPENEDHVLVQSNSSQVSSSSSISSDDDSTRSDSAPEIWDEASDEDEDVEDTSWTSLQYILSAFISLFQLSFHISDRAIAYLLAFLSALFSHLSSETNSPSHIQNFCNNCPKTLYSARKVLKLKRSVEKYVVCPRCHHLYKESDCISIVQGKHTSCECEFVKFPHHPHAVRRKKCGVSLMKTVKISQKCKLVPKKTFIYYSIIDSLQRLFKVPGFLESCELWRKRKLHPNVLADVYDGNLWKEWMKIDGVPFLEIPGNLLFMLNIDWFQPYTHIQYSIGVIYLVIQNLPRKIRFKPENIIIVATIPGPKEPSCDDLNPYLDNMVDDLLSLWNGVLFATPSCSLPSKVIRGALTYISSDIPATRKICGFYGIRAGYGCSKCMKYFPSTSVSNNYSGFNREQWTPRTLADHNKHINEAKAAKTQTAHERIERKIGARYSQLLRLKYFDVVRYHLVDPMHNLFLGTSKRLLQLWKEHCILTDSDFESIQDQINDINPPPNIGRLPHKIAARFAGFTAEQWMIWTTVYSPFILRQYLPPEHYANWCLFAQACSLLCRPHVSRDSVNKADSMLLEFVKNFRSYTERMSVHQTCTCMDISKIAF